MSDLNQLKNEHVKIKLEQELTYVKDCMVRLRGYYYSLSNDTYNAKLSKLEEEYDATYQALQELEK